MSKKEKMTDKEKFLMYQKVFGTREGKLVLEDLKEISMFNKAMFDLQSNRLYFLEGRRSIICDINEVMELTLEELEEMEKENGTSYDPNAK